MCRFYFYGSNTNPYNTLSIIRVKPDANCVKVSNLLMHSSTEKIADIN